MRLSCICMLLALSWVPYGKTMCYSCAGYCYREPCNCQMGSCESNFCFIERKPADGNGRLRITKGCVKRPSRQTGCDFDYFHDNIQCVCSGNFCNDVIDLRPVVRNNVTCRRCPERDPNCGETCLGHWCHEDSTSGAAGCGYGPPALPFYYRGPDLLSHKTRLCVSLSRGAGKAHKHCVCKTNLCNSGQRNYYSWEDPSSNIRTLQLNNHAGNKGELSLQKCVSCEVTSHEVTTSASCKQDLCIGHFCTYTTQRSSFTGKNKRYSLPALTERQGCINVTDSTHIQLGCTHKWMDNEEEQLSCACKGDLCNKDLATASLSTASTSHSPSTLSLFLLPLFFHLRIS